MSYNAEDISSSESICPAANPQTCCEVLVEHTLRLVPPALADEKFPIIVKRRIDARVKKVCPEKVVVVGIVYKKITYKSIDYSGRIRNSEIYDHVKFHCVIDRDDANAGDKFEVVGAGIPCVVYEEPEDIRPCLMMCSFEVAHKFIEEDIVKVCVRKET